jgi:hypothetical protein
LDNISKITNLSRNEIDQILTEYIYHRGIHDYLLTKKVRGLPMPTTQNDLMRMLSEERPPFFDEIQVIMYNSIKKMLGYTNQYIRKQEEKRQKETYEKRIGTNKFKYKKN